MQSRIRNLAFGLSALSCWMLIVYAGYYLFGPGGASTFGIFSGIALLLASRLVIRWSKVKARERVMFGLAIFLAVAGGSYIAWVDYGYGLHKPREKMRQAARLQEQFESDSRFDAIQLTYLDPPDRKGEWLSVSGSVATESDQEILHKIIDDAENWQVEWDVKVLSDSSNEPMN